MIDGGSIGSFSKQLNVGFGVFEGNACLRSLANCLEKLVITV
jgi:hypothetical protein